MNTSPLSMKTWYTQPKSSFASFYYYLPDTKELVRIRMELGRSSRNSDDGSTRVIYRKNRYVGFSSERIADRETLRVEDNKIKGLEADPAEDLRVYDFSSANAQTPDKTPHVGNLVTTQPKLPKGVNEEMLRKVAEKAIANKKSKSLTPANASEDELSKVLREEAEQVNA